MSHIADLMALLAWIGGCIGFLSARGGKDWMWAPWWPLIVVGALVSEFSEKGERR